MTAKTTLLEKVEQLSAHAVSSETANTQATLERIRLPSENQWLRQKLDQYL
jgi:hypothetical protein